MTTAIQGWDRVLVRFMKNVGLHQALNGFENDMLVMNAAFEKEEIPHALQELRMGLAGLSEETLQQGTTCEDRALSYIHLKNGATPVSQTQLTRSISQFISQNRARNNASNRNEFLRKRRCVDHDTDGSMQEGTTSMAEWLPTCARTDAIPINRDAQVKYDIAKNEHGPLRRTVKSNKMDGGNEPKPNDGKGKGRMSPDGSDAIPTLERHPGLAERFTNLETHLAVRYVPSPPACLLDRIRFIEDYIMRLEREYPPWAALHFCQPNRGWPPPPRKTPLIVPSRLTSTSHEPTSEAENASASVAAPIFDWEPEKSQGGSGRFGVFGPKSKAKSKSSSLHRAVMDRLEVKKALAGED